MLQDLKWSGLQRSFSSFFLACRLSHLSPVCWLRGLLSLLYLLYLCFNNGITIQNGDYILKRNLIRVIFSLNHGFFFSCVRRKPDRIYSWECQRFPPCCMVFLFYYLCLHTQYLPCEPFFSSAEDVWKKSLSQYMCVCYISQYMWGWRREFTVLLGRLLNNLFEITSELNL